MTSRRVPRIHDVVAQIFDKDVRTKRKIKDVALFDRVQSYFINNYAAPTNLSNVIDYLHHTENVRIKRETLSKYLKLLEDAKILYRCPRFDLKSRRMLRGGDKFYLADTGIYTACNANAQISYGPALENVLYTHLRAKGYQVSVGRIGRLECDFIVRRNNMYWYIQVSRTIADPRLRNANTGPSTTSVTVSSLPVHPHLYRMKNGCGISPHGISCRRRRSRTVTPAKP
ncbi:MAG: DUF4143 domain-containing protein [Bifidobacterium breve]